MSIRSASGWLSIGHTPFRLSVFAPACRTDTVSHKQLPARPGLVGAQHSSYEGQVSVSVQSASGWLSSRHIPFCLSVFAPTCRTGHREEQAAPKMICSFSSAPGARSDQDLGRADNRGEFLLLEQLEPAERLPDSLRTLVAMFWGKRCPKMVCGLSSAPAAVAGARPALGGHRQLGHLCLLLSWPRTI